MVFYFRLKARLKVSRLTEINEFISYFKMLILKLFINSDLYS